MMKKRLIAVLSIILLVLVICITCFPFLMMVMGSFKEDYEIFSLTPTILPQNGFNLKMYKILFANWPFLRNMANSIIVTVITTILACVFCTMAGVTFAKYNFPFKNALFIIMLSSLMVPLETRLVPTYMLIRSMGGANKMWSLIIINAILAK